MLAKMQKVPYSVGEVPHQLQERTTLDLVIISGDLTEDGEVEDYRYLKNWSAGSFRRNRDDCHTW